MNKSSNSKFDKYLCFNPSLRQKSLSIIAKDFLLDMLKNHEYSREAISIKSSMGLLNASYGRKIEQNFKKKVNCVVILSMKTKLGDDEW